MPARTSGVARDTPSVEARGRWTDRRNESTRSIRFYRFLRFPSQRTLAPAADRVAPTAVLSPESEGCAQSLVNAAHRLSLLVVKPCEADKDSSPGRLAVWATIVKRNKESQTGDWQELLLQMMNSESSIERLAGFQWLPPTFTRYDAVPWKKLFLDRRTAFYATQEAQRHPPANLAELAQECLDEATDATARNQLRELVEQLKTQKH